MCITATSSFRHNSKIYKGGRACVLDKCVSVVDILVAKVELSFSGYVGNEK